VSSFPETEGERSTSLDDGTSMPEGRAFQIALIFFGVTILLAILFAIYVLAWDGGAHT
jgi:hypothetical protein